jgi:Fur family peroxide stress response transcriptional regulator
MEIFRERCKEYNLKVTPQRTIIFSELQKSRDHPSAEKMFRKARKVFPNISFDTVNRTVLTFAEIGLIDIVEGYGEPKRFDPVTETHHHFRCVKCNTITDFASQAYDSLNVPEEIEKQFTVLRKKVCIEGLCSRCRKR